MKNVTTREPSRGTKEGTKHLRQPRHPKQKAAIFPATKLRIKEDSLCHQAFLISISAPLTRRTLEAMSAQGQVCKQLFFSATTTDSLHSVNTTFPPDLHWLSVCALLTSEGNFKQLHLVKSNCHSFCFKSNYF